MNHEAGDASLSVAEEPLLPVRMLNEFTYCPRLAYFEWVQGEFTDNAETVEGRFHHRRVDVGPQRAHRESAGDEEETSIHHRSVWMSSERLGITAKMDLVEKTKGAPRRAERRRPTGGSVKWVLLSSLPPRTRWEDSGRPATWTIGMAEDPGRFCDGHALYKMFPPSLLIPLPPGVFENSLFGGWRRSLARPQRGPYIGRGARTSNDRRQDPPTAQ